MCQNHLFEHPKGPGVSFRQPRRLPFRPLWSSYSPVSQAFSGGISEGLMRSPRPQTGLKDVFEGPKWFGNDFGESRVRAPETHGGRSGVACCPHNHVAWAHRHTCNTALRSKPSSFSLLKACRPYQYHYCRNRDFTTRRAPTPPDASYIPDASGPDTLYDTVRRVVQCLKQHSAPPPLLSNTLPPPPPLS